MSMMMSSFVFTKLYHKGTPQKCYREKRLVDASLEAMDFLDDAAAKEQISLIDRGDLSRGYHLDGMALANVNDTKKQPKSAVHRYF